MNSRIVDFFVLIVAVFVGIWLAGTAIVDTKSALVNYLLFGVIFSITIGVLLKQKEKLKLNKVEWIWLFIVSTVLWYLILLWVIVDSIRR